MDCPLKYWETQKNYYNTITALCEPFLLCNTSLGEILNFELNSCIPDPRIANTSFFESLPPIPPEYRNEDGELLQPQEDNLATGSVNCTCNNGVRSTKLQHVNKCACVCNGGWQSKLILVHIQRVPRF